VAKKNTKICSSCNKLFLSRRSDAVTCSERCRKRLQRMRTKLDAEARSIESVATHVLSKIEHEFVPTIADEAGFVGDEQTATQPAAPALPAAPAQPAPAPQLIPISSTVNPTPASQPIPAAPVSTLVTSVPPVSVPPTTPLATGLPGQPPTVRVNTEAESLEVPVLVAPQPTQAIPSIFSPNINHATSPLIMGGNSAANGGSLKGSQQSRFTLPILKLGASLTALLIFAAAGVLIVRSDLGNKKAPNIGTTPAVTSSVSDSIHFNRDTVVAGGHSLAATGPVLFKNQIDSTQAFAVQDASGATMINVDTTNGIVFIRGLQGSGSGLTDLNATNLTSGTVANGRLSSRVTLAGNTFNGPNQLVMLDSAGNLPPLDGAALFSLNASNVSIGTLNDARLSPNVALLNANQTFTGNNSFTGNNGFSGSNTFSGDNGFTGINTFSNSGNSFTGDGAGLTNLNASNLTTGTVNDARLSNNVALLNANQSFSGTNTFNGSTIQHGNYLFQSTTNSLNAFQIQNAAGNDNLLVADTINTRIGIGVASPNYTLDVNGDVNVSAGHTFRIDGQDVCSSGLCNPSSGSGFYVQNTTNLQTAANFNIQSAANTDVGGIIRGAVGQTADLFEGQNSGGGIVFALDPFGNVNIAGQYEINGAPICTSGGCTAASGSGSYIQNGIALQANANFNIESTNAAFVGGIIRGASGQTADLLQLKDGNGNVVTSVGSQGAFLAKDTNSGSHTFFQIQNPSSVSLFTADTVTGQILLPNANVSSTALLFGGDANLYRSASSTLKTDGNLIVAGNTTLNGTVLAKNASNSTTAFQVQQSASTTPVFDVDTTNARVGIGTSTPDEALTIANGNIDLQNGVLYQSMYATDDGLVLYYPFSQVNGTITYDKSPTGQDATLSGATTTTGKYGQALSFNGSSSSITATNSKTNSALKTNTFSTSAWVFPTGPSSSFGNGIASFVTTCSRADGWDLVWYPDHVAFDVGTTGGGNIGASYNVDASTYYNKWTQVTATYSGGVSSLYLNGELVASNTVADTYVVPGTSVDLEVGFFACNSFGGDNFNGKIDEFKLYNRAISVDEVKTQYLGGLQSNGYITSNNFRLLNTAGQANLRVAASGATVFQNSTNSTAAFQIQNSAGLSLFTADTTNFQVNTTKLQASSTIASTSGTANAQLSWNYQATTGLTMSGNEITDASRLINTQGDGRTPPDSSTGIWEATTNLTSDGGFESGSTIGTWWRLSPGACTATIANSTNAAKFGSQSVDIHPTSSVSGCGILGGGNSPGGTGGSGTDHVIAATAGNTYTVSAWVNAPSGRSMQIALGYADISRNATSNTVNNFTATGSWQRVTVTATAPANTTSMSVNVSQTSTFTEDWYVDGVQFEQKSIATPYVDTNTSTASRTQATVQGPSSLLNATQGWFAARVRMGYAANIGNGANTRYLFSWQNTANNNDGYDLNVNQGVFMLRSAVATVPTSVSSSALNHNPGDLVTVVASWTSTTLSISINGGAFTTVARSSVPAPSSSTFFIGNLLGSAVTADDDYLWSATGTGTLTNNDATNFNSYGNTDPLLSSLTTFGSGAAAPTMVWNGINSNIQGTSGTAQSSLTLDDVSLTHTAAGSVALQGLTNSTTALQVQNASGVNQLVVDTTNQRVAIGPGAVPANGTLTVGTNTTTASGGIYFGTDTSLYRSTAGDLTVSAGNAPVAFDISSTNSRLTINGANANGNYGVLQGDNLITSATGNLYLGTPSATTALKIASTTGAILAKNATDSATGFQIQNTGGTAVLGVDTVNQAVSVTNLQSTGIITLQNAQGASIQLRTVSSSSTGLILSGNEINDTNRSTSLQGDGRQPPDSSTGIWEATTNLITNGGFETNTTGWAIGTAGTITRDTTKSKFGSASLKMVHSGVGQANSPSFTITNTSTYTLSYWYYVPSGQTGVTSFETPFTGFSTSQDVFTPTFNQWTRRTITLTANATTGQVGFRLFPDAGTTGGQFFYIDGVQVEQKAYATPYVETNGGAASRSAARVQLPSAVGSGLASSSNMWFAARVRMGVSSTTYASLGLTTSILSLSDGSTNNYIQLYAQNASFGFQAHGSGGYDTAQPSSSWNAGDIVTVVGYLTSSQIAISINGSSFTVVTRTPITPTGINTYDIGSDRGVSQIDSDILWTAAGTGTLSDADAAAMNRYGNSDPTLTSLTPLNSGAAKPSFAWDGESSQYSGTNSALTVQSGISLDDVTLYHSSSGTIGLAGSGSSNQGITLNMKVTSSVNANDVVIIDTANAGQVTTVGATASTGVFGVATTTNSAGATQGIVVSGIYQVRADTNAVNIGDVLVTSATTGQVASSTSPASGTVIGRALSAKSAGSSGLVWAYITPGAGGSGSGSGSASYGLMESDWVNTGATLPTVWDTASIATVGNTVYMFGGSNGSATNKIYSAPVSNPTNWTDTGSTLPGTLSNSSLAIVGNTIYLFGGTSGGGDTNVIYSAPVSSPTTWTNTGATLPATLSDSSLAVINNNIYLFGGHNGTFTNAIYRASTGNPTSWVNTGSTIPGSEGGSSLAVIGNYVYLFGGNINSGPFVTNAIYRAPISSPTSWTTMSGTIPTAVTNSSLAVIGNYVYLFGGDNGSGATTTIYRALINNPTSWTTLSAVLPAASRYPASAIIGNAMYLFGGNGTNAIYSAPIFNGDPDLSSNPSWKVAANVAGGGGISTGNAGTSTELAYTEFTTNVSITHTTEGTADSVISAGALTFDGITPYVINFYSPRVDTPPGTDVILVLYQDGSSIGQIGWHNGFNATGGSNDSDSAMLLTRRLTPSAGSHTYSIRAYIIASGTATIYGGPGGSGSQVPGYIRITLANPLQGGTNGGIQNGTTTQAGNFNVQSNNANNAAGILKGASGQSADVFDVQNSSGTNLLRVDPNGNVSAAGTIGFTGVGNTNQGITTNFVVTSSVNANDVVAIDTNNAGQLTTTNTQGSTKVFGVATQTKIAGQSQPIVVSGVYQVTADTNAVNVGDFLISSSTAGQVVSSNSPSAGSVIGRALSAKAGGSSGLVWIQVTPGLGGGGGSTGGLQSYGMMESDWVNTGSTLPAARGDSQVTTVGNTLYMFGGADSGGTAVNTIYSAPVSNPNNWTNTGSTLPAALSDSQLAIIGGTIYLFGGVNAAGNATNVIYSASVSSPTIWTNTGSTLPGVLGLSQLAVIGSNIYLFGGINAGGATNVIYSAPVATPTVWTNTGSTIPGLVRGQQLAVIGSYVYLFGGHLSSSSTTNAIYRAPVSSPTSWTTMSGTLPANIGYSSLVIVGSNIYLLGGWNSSGGQTSAIFKASINNPASWTTVTGAVLPGTLSDSQVMIVGNAVYLFGGQSGANLNIIYSAPIFTNSPDTTSNPSWKVAANTSSGGGSSTAGELAYAQFTSTVSTVATTDATATTVVTAPTFNSDGSTPVHIDVFYPSTQVQNAGEQLITVLYDGATIVGRIGAWTSNSSTLSGSPDYMSYEFTPSAGSHSFSARIRSGSGGTVYANAGTAGSGNFTPGYIRVTTANGTGGSAGSVANGTAVQTGNFNVQSAGAALVTATIQGAAGQSADLLEVKDGSGNIVFNISSSGNVALGSPSASPPLLVLGTKNTSGDPTCTAGAVYYNSSSSSFRGCSNGSWINLGPKELAYNEFTSTVTATSSTLTSAVTVVSSGAMTFDGTTKVRLEFFCPAYSVSDSSNGISVALFDGSTSNNVGVLFNGNGGTGGGPAYPGGVFMREFTPSAGSHTYFVGVNDFGAIVGAHASVKAGTGASSNYVPGYIRISVAN